MTKIIVDTGKDIFLEKTLNNHFKTNIEDDLLKIEIEDYHQVSNLLANHILKFIIPQIIAEEIDLACFDLLDDDIEEDITERVEWLFLHKNDLSNQLQEEIYEGLIKHHIFNLNGFINFRLNDKRLQIKEIVDIALEEYFENEYNEQFASSIRRIVSIQQPQINLIHLIVLDSNQYEIITDDNKRVDLSEVEEIIDNLIKDEDDIMEQLHYILSILMTLIPKEIVIHINETQDPYIVQMLKKIYINRISLCHYCDFCSHFKK